MCKCADGGCALPTPKRVSAEQLTAEQADPSPQADITDIKPYN